MAKKDVIHFKKSFSRKWTLKETHDTVETVIKAFNKVLEIEEKVKKSL